MPDQNPVIDLSGGLVPKQPAQSSGIDLSAGLLPKGPAPQSGVDQEAAAFANLGQTEHQQTTQTPMKGSTLGGVVGQLREGPDLALGTSKAAVAQKYGERVQQGLDEANQGKITSAGIGVGGLKGLFETAHTVGRAANAVTGDNVPGLPTTLQEPSSLQAENKSEAIGKGAEGVMEFLAGDEALKGLSWAEKFKKMAKVAEILETHPTLGKAAIVGFNSLRTGVVGAGQATLHGATPGEAAQTGALAGVTGGALETLGEGLSALKNYIWPANVLRYIGQDGVVQEIAAADAGKIPSGAKLIRPGATQTAEATAKGGLPAQQAGQRVQQEAKTVRDLVGQKVGAAKDAVEASIPETTDGSKVAMTLQPNSKSTLAAKSILDDLGNQKLDINDPNTASVRKIAEHLAAGKDLNGNMFSLDPSEIDLAKRELNKAIQSQQVAVRNGANGTALGYLKQLKGALQDDIYDYYAKVGDADAAANLRKVSQEYADVVNDQTKGPAKGLLKTQKPEQIINSIISGGENSQTTVDALMRNISPDGQKVLRDSVTKQLYGKNTLPSGDINMEAVQGQFNRMGETGKKLYGDGYNDLKAFIDTAADFQKEKNSGGIASRIKDRVVGGSIKAVSSAAGAHVAGAGGAVVGHEIGSELAEMAISPSGAVKVGVSPTEKITLAPDLVNEPGVIHLLSVFGKAATRGDLKTATAALAGLQEYEHQAPPSDLPNGATHFYRDGQIQSAR
jgi:hypothetical protein